MKPLLRRWTIVGILCVTLLGLPAPSRADSLTNDAIGVGIAIGATGAAIGIGIYYIVRSSKNLSGCAMSAGSGFELRKDDQQVWTLIGDTASIKSGDRIRVVGKKKKKDATGAHIFVVEKLAKDYGPCTSTR